MQQKQSGRPGELIDTSTVHLRFPFVPALMHSLHLLLFDVLTPVLRAAAHHLTITGLSHWWRWRREATQPSCGRLAAGKPGCADVQTYGCDFHNKSRRHAIVSETDESRGSCDQPPLAPIQKCALDKMAFYFLLQERKDK